MRTCVAVVAMLAAAVPVLAGPFDGVFASSEEGCAHLKSDGVQALFEHDFLVMTLADGINANEFHCDFLRADATADGAAMVITSFCEYPGEPFGDLITLREFSEGSITVTSLREYATQSAMGGEGWLGTEIYYQCPGMDRLPR